MDIKSTEILFYLYYYWISGLPPSSGIVKKITTFRKLDLFHLRAEADDGERPEIQRVVIVIVIYHRHRHLDLILFYFRCVWAQD
jgi:hypothetical protein